MCAWRTCYSSSNNIHFDFPPIMADGRNYATWQPEAVVNERIQQKENITTNWQYRQYMTTNGNQIMSYNTLEACYDLGLNPQIPSASVHPSNSVPLLYKSTHDTTVPSFGYSNSDLKNPYLSREQLNSRMIAPSISGNMT